ncbi:acyl-CoA dehydrogenase NM domain-like protein [Gonapodya prolifera JEL478]|uniref:Acyl-CoA dehydrogenase NM domain-like protein n=1 Tax=Gonapodya prolifera (strain JEL478) TaxID=1344416 RepID=A0A139AYS0_GONPJ|nr:acyl-CoA dehydrogenase NM domain-like protein [Gonapodya prolifera JEL478]|eukprot:KXS21857.1 acyl-CoA dehydrogenase NM domain-like protein [Gonapodya prolifera JEL478]
MSLPFATTRTLKKIPRPEIASHDRPGDSWLVIDSIVYDVSTFADFHPGGAGILLEYAGKDATEAFYGLHRHDVIVKFGPRLAIGTVANESPKVVNTVGAFSQVPYAEAPQVRKGFAQLPYYRQSHEDVRNFMRQFVEENVREEATLKEETGEAPSKELVLKVAKAGIFQARLGPGPHQEYLSQLGFRLPCGITPKEFDFFHELIVTEELARTGMPGFFDGLGTGLVIGLPPVINFGHPSIKERVVREVLSGEKSICLAITEPTAGSDVAGIRTTATLDESGKYFVVNGTKKWITNGMWADYFSTLCRTPGGMTMLLIPRGEGVEAKPVRTSYSAAAGTSYITFENVRVPVSHVIGEVGQGLKVTLTNFNHERWFITSEVHALTRYVVAECIKWTNQRKVFGTPLISQPVIRQKLARMISNVEADCAWLEALTHQMMHMTYNQQAEHLAGPLGLLKFKVTRTAALVSDEAVQIFGGRGITRTGMGRVIEQFNRFYKLPSVYGGSEEIVADLGIRQAMKKMPNEKL